MRAVSAILVLFIAVLALPARANGIDDMPMGGMNCCLNPDGKSCSEESCFGKSITLPKGVGGANWHDPAPDTLCVVQESNGFALGPCRGNYCVKSNNLTVCSTEPWVKAP